MEDSLDLIILGHERASDSRYLAGLVKPPTSFTQQIDR
jgi:hypothetical protein